MLGCCLGRLAGGGRALAGAGSCEEPARPVGGISSCSAGRLMPIDCSNSTCVLDVVGPSGFDTVIGDDTFLFDAALSPRGVARSMGTVAAVVEADDILGFFFGGSVDFGEQDVLVKNVVSTCKRANLDRASTTISRHVS